MNCSVEVALTGSVGGGAFSEATLATLQSFVPSEEEDEGEEEEEEEEGEEEEVDDGDDGYGDCDRVESEKISFSIGKSMSDVAETSLLMGDELLRSSWQPLESPSAQLARCSLLSDLGMDVEAADAWSLLMSPLTGRRKSAADHDQGLAEEGRKKLAPEDLWDPSDRLTSNLDGSLLISSLPQLQKRQRPSYASAVANNKHFTGLLPLRCLEEAHSSLPPFTTVITEGEPCIDKLLKTDLDDSLVNVARRLVADPESEEGAAASSARSVTGFDFGGSFPKKARPIFSHWNRQGLCGEGSNGSSSSSSLVIKPTVGRISAVPSLSSLPRVRRSASEFCSTSSSTSVSMAASRAMSPVMGDEISHLLQSSLGVEPCLPCFDSPRDAIKRITPTVLTEVLAGAHAHQYERLLIVDCRYPYEYHGGHLPGAINVCSLDAIDQLLFSPATLGSGLDTHSTLIIFHCEFSSERAPRMALHVRNYDRMINAANYPHLHYPQVYILDGGYKSFFLQYPTQCDPPGQYVPMRNMHNREELRHHQRQKLNDGQSSKHRHKVRSCSLRHPLQKAHSLAMPHPVSAISTFFRTREGTVASGVLPGDAMSLNGPLRSTMELLSSDIGDIYDQADTVLQAAEHFLLTDHALTEGRLSK